jgi:hypothetical protein
MGGGEGKLHNILEMSGGEGKLQNISGDEGRRGKSTEHFWR